MQTTANSLTPIGIALGSNLGDRLANLRRAMELMRERVSDFKLIAAGGLYETEPVDCPAGSLPFFNTVVEIECGEPLAALHRQLVAIERVLGRESVRPPNAPRPIDLDVLYAGDLRMSDELLTVPHPRMCQRRFVLRPLADIRPGLIPPGQRLAIRELLDELPDPPDAVRLVMRDWAA